MSSRWDDDQFDAEAEFKELEDRHKSPEQRLSERAARVRGYLFQLSRGVYQNEHQAIEACLVANTDESISIAETIIDEALATQADSRKARLTIGTASISALNAMPMEQLRFRDFVALKSGRDQYSRLDVMKLSLRVEPSAVEQVVAAFANEDEQAKCLRWCCRGLEVTRAIRKIKADLEVSGRARAASAAKLDLRRHRATCVDPHCWRCIASEKGGLE